VAVVAALGDEQERFIDDAHANMRKAHEELKEAHDVLIEIVRLLRQERLDLPEHASYEIAAKAEGSA
jgi:cellobiose-specific phosphotransferase system component IIA